MTFDFGLEFFREIYCVVSKPRLFGLFAESVLPFMNYFKDTLAFFIEIFLIFFLVNRIFKMRLGEFSESFFVFRNHFVEVFFVFGHVMILSVTGNQIHRYLVLNFFFCRATILQNKYMLDRDFPMDNEKRQVNSRDLRSELWRHGFNDEEKRFLTGFWEKVDEKDEGTILADATGFEASLALSRYLGVPLNSKIEELGKSFSSAILALRSEK